MRDTINDLMHNRFIWMAFYGLIIITSFISIRAKQRERMNLSPEQQKEQTTNAFMGVIKRALIGGIICFTFCAAAAGFFYFNQKEIDGEFVNTGETIDLNEALKNGEIPENGVYVTVRFSLVGEGYLANDDDVIYHPIVVSDTGEKPYVIAVSESTNTDFLAKSGYIQSSAPYLKEGADHSDKMELEFTGRLSDINSTYDKYTASLESSNMTFSNYTIKNIFVNSVKSRDELRVQLNKLFMIFVILIFLDVFMIISTIVVYKYLKL